MREDDDSGEAYEDARRPRTVEEALGDSEALVRAAGQLAGACLYGDAWARGINAQANGEVGDLLR